LLLGTLKPGEWRYLTPQEITSLKEDRPGLAPFPDMTRKSPVKAHPKGIRKAPGRTRSTGGTDKPTGRTRPPSEPGKVSGPNRPQNNARKNPGRTAPPSSDRPAPSGKEKPAGVRKPAIRKPR